MSTGMSSQKRRLAGSDSDTYSSFPPSVESGMKGRGPQRPPRGKDMEMQMEEHQNKMKELENQMDEHRKIVKEMENQMEGMKKLRKGMKELRRQNKEQGNEIKQLRNRVEEQEKEMKKLRKELRNKPNTNTNTNCLPFGTPSSSRSVQEGNTKNLKLRIEMKVPKRVYTGDKLVGDPGNRIPISLIDAENGQTITSGKESSVTVLVVALDGNFNRGGHEYWPAEEFDHYIVKGRKQKGQPLIGDLEVVLEEGVGFINNLKFMDNSSWNQDKKFRIGVHVASGYYEGSRIREAFTEPFTVLEHRGASNKKHDTPESSDDVWRLEGIGRDGRFHNRLKEAGINNVEGFLQSYNGDPEALKSILGRAMTTTKWSSLVEHAQKCPPNGQWLVYYCDGSNYAPLFDNFARLTGFIWNGVPRLINSLSDREKQATDGLVKLARQNWKEVMKYEGIIPHHEAMAVPPGNYGTIPVGPSISQNHPTQISLQDHPGPSGFLSQGYSSLHDATTNSGMAAEEATTSQQAFQAWEPSADHLPPVPTSSLDYLLDQDIDDGIYTEEVLSDLMRQEKPPDI